MGQTHYRDERYHDEPNKNAYSHPHDALQYAMCGGGEVRALTGTRVPSPIRPTMAATEFNVWSA